MDEALGDLSGWLGFRVSIPENPAGGHLPMTKNLPLLPALVTLCVLLVCFWFLFVCLGTGA